MHADLIGKVYQNGDGGGRYRVVKQDPEFSSLVFVERLSDGTRGSAIADFVRYWLEDDAN